MKLKPFHGKILAVVIVVAAIVGVVSFFAFSEQPTSATSQQPAASAGGNVIQMTDSGFSPSVITINKGDSVTFVDVSGVHWPASNPHPIHTGYPGSSITECDTGASIFDACGGLQPGQSFTFQFNDTGSWGFHDHLRPRFTGTVVVQ